jgi:hypothetical protein
LENLSREILLPGYGAIALGITEFCEIQDEKITVLVVRGGHRREVYKKL